LWAHVGKSLITWHRGSQHPCLRGGGIRNHRRTGQGGRRNERQPRHQRGTAGFVAARRADPDEEPDIELVGQASDGTEAVEKAAESLPDVVLMDIRMPRSNGIEACRAMKEAAPSAKIVILTISDEEEDLFEAIRAGASGYLLKDIPLDEVADTVRAVYGGQSLINPSMAGKLLTEFATLARRDGEERAQELPAPRLTDREMQVLKLVARGMNNRDIAKELFISENTVKNHVRNILEKLQIHSRMEAVMVAVREKLIEFS
jgi:DNA-binding NarL/FixJ family response regulator